MRKLIIIIFLLSVGFADAQFVAQDSSRNSPTSGYPVTRADLFRYVRSSRQSDADIQLRIDVLASTIKTLLLSKANDSIITNMSFLVDSAFKIANKALFNTASISGKFNNPTGTISQYLRGDGTTATFPALVNSFNGRNGNINLLLGDITTLADSRYLQSYTETDPVWSAASSNYSTTTQSNVLYAAVNHTHSIAQINGLQAQLFSGSYTDLTNKPSLFDGSYNSLTNRPTLFNGVYSSLTGIPLSFTPSAHTHTIGDVTGLQTTLDGKQASLGFTPYNSTNPNNYISSVPAQTFASLTGKPTTLSGYGITDAYPLTGNPSNFLTAVPAQSWSSITGKPSTLSGYGIADAYPLTGNPSAFLTSITQAQINTALGYTPYNGATNPNGFLVSYTETDPTVSATVKAITSTNVTNWNTAYGWGNHATAGYATTASVALKLNITDTAAAFAAYMRKTFPSGVNGITYNATTGVISKKRQETYSGTTDASGNYTIVFSTPYTVTPNVQPNILGGTALQRVITNASATGFTIQTLSQNTNTLLGIVNLVAGTTVVSGASIQVLVTEN